MEQTKCNKKWKDKLLSSSLPLEYEVGKILTNSNFYVDFDYSYKRYDNALEKEFSFDIKAGGFYPFEEDTEVKMNIDLLIECKYRNPNTSWLFIKDINKEEFSSFSSKGVLKFIEEFTQITSKNKYSDFVICETCLKGIEINVQNGEVHDTGINHGLNQLIYSIPVLLKYHIEGNLGNHINDAHPYIICPILVTTADLRILKDEFSIEQLKMSESLSDISNEVPYLRLYSDVYPSFVEHCKNIFKNVPDYEDHFQRLESFKKFRKTEYDEKGFPKLIYGDPEMLLIGLKEGIENELFREILVCSLKHLPELIQQIKEGIDVIGDGLEEIKKSN